ncbi:MAG: cob(I)yrinic acid a,c-diamide adenosyltransferase [Chthoniobacteraceae bacterium]
MSISTQTGDQGSTSLLYGRRVPKTDHRIACNGAVDELNAQLGMARAFLKGSVGDPFITEKLFKIQKELIVLMGEVAVAPEDRERHRTSTYGVTTPEMVQTLTDAVHDLEQNHQIEFHRWATPGDSVASASVELARVICRRAERLIVGLRETDPGLSVEIIRYLNRLSDLLWLWARWVETQENKPVEENTTA